MHNKSHAGGMLDLQDMKHKGAVTMHSLTDIYIYICVCVCVCVCAHKEQSCAQIEQSCVRVLEEFPKEPRRALNKYSKD
jgi:hypothetical protein